jgi:sugar/nucleoside kinase (ribokinase family)
MEIEGPLRRKVSGFLLGEKECATMLPDLDYLVIGHVCQDVVPSGVNSPFVPGYIFGGTVTYAARTAKAIGLRVAVVTSASAEFALGAALPGIETVRLPSAETTTFENRYLDGHRIQTIHAVAGNLDIQAVPLKWRRPSVVHLAPLAREVDMQLVSAFSGAFVGVTPQGWLRQWDNTGRVRPRAWQEAHAILSCVDAMVMSEEDVNEDWKLIRDWANYTPVMVVTQAARGATMFIEGEPFHVPAPPTREVDPTGAGDIFATVFFARLQQTGDPHEAARMATCLAAHSVTRHGLESVPTPDEAKQCLVSMP